MSSEMLVFTGGVNDLSTPTFKTPSDGNVLPSISSKLILKEKESPKYVTRGSRVCFIIW